MAKRRRGADGRFLKGGKGGGKGRGKGKGGGGKGGGKGRGKGGGGGQTLAQRALYVVVGGAGAAVLASYAARVQAASESESTRDIAAKAPLLMAAGGAALGLIPRVPSAAKLAGLGIAAVGVALLVSEGLRQKGQPGLAIAPPTAAAPAAPPALPDAQSEGLGSSPWLDRARASARRLARQRTAEPSPGRMGDAELALGYAQAWPGQSVEPRVPAQRLHLTGAPQLAAATYGDLGAALEPGAALSLGDIYTPGQAGYYGRV